MAGAAATAGAAAGGAGAAPGGQPFFAHPICTTTGSYTVSQPLLEQLGMSNPEFVMGVSGVRTGSGVVGNQSPVLSVCYGSLKDLINGS